ncbi:NACHT, LRR and PYD domains-containing protein 5 [Smittium culicis]|uniref:NACHT, LRR and PYD domains-containing protein 5 n=1 Tax=Smittium culicis TaxID=133412 RepID=A0A1R1YP93_9FUNG|nr:NACHT, LRR and PYD domains-containing protein 5 [Smittium culicis]
MVEDSDLSYLYLDNCSISLTALERILIAVKTSKLKCLFLRKNNLKGKHCSALRRFLSGTNVDGSFRQDQNSINSQCYESPFLHLEKSILSTPTKFCYPKLKVLDLSHNLLGPEIGSFIHSLESNYYLNKLVLRNNSITSFGASSLVEGILKNSSLYQLDVSNNSLMSGPNGGMVTDSFCQLIKRTKISKLVLDNCELNNAFSTSVALAISLKSKLRHLDLSNNRCHSAETLKTFISVSKNSNLRTVKFTVPGTNSEINGLVKELNEICSLNSS